MDLAAPDRPTQDSLDHRAAPLSALEPDPSCCDRTNWRCTLGTTVDPEALERSLADRGYRAPLRHPRLRIFRRMDGHEIAWVLDSGRIQIRVPLGLAADSRADAARQVWLELQGSARTLGPV
ncbi:MAG: hypothetical protein MI919_30895 [Holophagales bacterium]|nr:hypothetical protein [Holophagales bacterium]